MLALPRETLAFQNTKRSIIRDEQGSFFVPPVSTTYSSETSKFPHQWETIGSISEIPALHLKKQNLLVQVTSFRTEYRPIGVHSVIKTSSSLYLRKRGISPVLYLDDMLVIGSAFHETQQFTRITAFIINLEKSILIPTQIITFLGFTINSISMILSLPLE